MYCLLQSLFSSLWCLCMVSIWLGTLSCHVLLYWASPAIVALLTLLKTVGWYREIHRPALGAGIFGLILGIWATLFSAWGAALANLSVRDSFFWVALITAFMICSPEELPLQVDGDGSANEVLVHSKKAGFKENTNCPDLSSAELCRTRQIWIQYMSQVCGFVVWSMCCISMMSNCKCWSFTATRIRYQIYYITRHVSLIQC